MIARQQFPVLSTRIRWWTTKYSLWWTKTFDLACFHCRWLLLILVRETFTFPLGIWFHSFVNFLILFWSGQAAWHHEFEWWTLVRITRGRLWRTIAPIISPRCLFGCSKQISCCRMSVCPQFLIWQWFCLGILRLAHCCLNLAVLSSYRRRSICSKLLHLPISCYFLRSCQIIARTVR